MLEIKFDTFHPEMSHFNCIYLLNSFSQLQDLAKGKDFLYRVPHT